MPDPVLIEVCVDSLESAIAAEQGGADRIELCGSLLEGGITPSAGLIEVVRRRVSLPLHVMIRPRGGDFCYSSHEIDIMQRDIARAKTLGTDGVVLGVLELSGRVDVERTRQFVDLARPLSLTFHRAFDMTPNIFQSLDDVCGTGAHRILTSGSEQTSLKGIEAIATLVKTAGVRIGIIAGSGINAANVSQILEHTGVREIHVGLSSTETSPMLYQNSRILMGKLPGREYVRTLVRSQDVQALREAVARQ